MPAVRILIPRVLKLFRQFGYTLVEILLVIVLMAILSSLILPRFLNQGVKVGAAEAVNTLGVIKRAEQQFRDETGLFMPNSADVNWNLCLFPSIQQILGVDIQAPCNSGRGFAYWVNPNGDGSFDISTAAANAVNFITLRTFSDDTPDCWTGGGNFSPNGGQDWPNLTPVC